MLPTIMPEASYFLAKRKLTTDELDRSSSRNILINDSYHEDQESFGHE